jgi:hypothetical protein
LIYSFITQEPKSLDYGIFTIFLLAIFHNCVNARTNADYESTEFREQIRISKGIVKQWQNLREEKLKGEVSAEKQENQEKLQKASQK